MWNHFWAIFIDIWRLLSGHTDKMYEELVSPRTKERTAFEILKCLGPHQCVKTSLPPSPHILLTVSGLDVLFKILVKNVLAKNICPFLGLFWKTLLFKWNGYSMGNVWKNLGYFLIPTFGHTAANTRALSLPLRAALISWR